MPAKRKDTTMTSNESRITNLEKEAMALGSRIEELSSDTAEELKAIRQEIKQGHIDIGKALDSHAESLMQEICKTNERLNTIEATMVTKDELKSELAAMETRIRQDVASLRDGLREALKDLKK